VLIVGFYWLPAIFIFVETECQLVGTTLEHHNSIWRVGM